MNTHQAQVAGLVVAGHKPGEMTPEETIDKVRPASRPLEAEFDDHFIGLGKRFSQEDRERDLSLFRRGIRNQRMYEGDHYGYWNPLTRRWHAKSIEREDPFYPVNKFRYYADGVTTQHTQAKITTRFIPSSDDDRTISAAQFARRVAEYEEDRIYQESFLQDEIKGKMFFGQVYTLSYWDPQAGPMVPRPVYKPREDQYLAEDAYICAGCGRSGGVEELLMVMEATGDQEPRCITCKSSDLALFEVDPLSVPEINGYEQVPVGDIDCKIIPSLQVKYDRAGGNFKLGLYVRRQFRVRYEVIEEIFPWYDHKAAGGSGDGNESSAEAMDAVENSTGNIRGGRSTRSDADRLLVEQWWYRPAAYSRYRVPKDLRLAGGITLRRNTLIRDEFPDGMYQLVVNGKALDYRRENFLKHWQQTRFISVPNRSDGDGIEDMVRPQQEYNEGRSLRATHVKFNASPPIIFTDPLKEGDFTGRPQTTAHVKGLPKDKKPADLAHQMPTRPLDQNTELMVQSADQEMQVTSKSLPSSLGMADDNEVGGQRTFSGLRLMSDNATNLRSPELALGAEGHIERVRQWLDLFQENAVEARYIPFRGRNGEKAGGYFKGSDIDAHFTIVAKKNSWLPKSAVQRQTNLSNALSIGNGIVINPQVPAEWRQLILDEFDIDIELDDHALDAKLARSRIEEMTAKLGHAMQMAEQIVMPMFAEDLDPTQAAQPDQQQQALTEIAADLLAEMVPIMSDAEIHPVHIQFYANWAKSDEGQNAHPVLLMAALRKIRQHKQAMQLAQQEQLMADARIQAPLRKEATDEANTQADKDTEREMGKKAAETEIATSAEQSKMTHAKLLEGNTNE